MRRSDGAGDLDRILSKARIAKGDGYAQSGDQPAGSLRLRWPGVRNYGSIADHTAHLRPGDRSILRLRSDDRSGLWRIL